MWRCFCALAILLSAISLKADPFERFEEKGKFGLKDESGNIVIPAAFEALGWSDGNFSVIGQVTGYKTKERWGIINLQKQFITPADYETMTYPGGDHLLVSKRINPFTTKFGCLDLKGKVTVPFYYDGIAIQGLRAIVFIKNGTRYEHGLIDLNGRGIVPLHYRHIRPIGPLRYAIENFESKMALFSEDGAQLTKFLIDSISSYREGMAIIYQDFSRGLIDREGIIKIPIVFRDIAVQQDGNVLVRNFDEWKILDTNNKEIRSLAADELERSGDKLYKVTIGGKSGLANEDLQTVFAITCDYIGCDDHGNRAFKKDGKFGIMRRDFSMLLPPTFDSLSLDGNFIRTVQWQNGKKSWVLYDTFGIRKTISAYDLLQPFNGTYFAAKKHGYWGAVNRYGEETIKCVFDSLIEVNNRVVLVKLRGQLGIVDVREKWLLPPQLGQVSLINEDFYFERSDSTMFVKNFHGDIIYFTSNPITVNDNGLREVLPSGNIKYLNFQGMQVFPETSGKSYSAAPSVDFREGLSLMKRDGKYGFVDQRGRLRVANRYDDAREFREGLAPVKLIGKWGFVDAADHIVINPNFEYVEQFSGNIAIAIKNTKAGLIDKTGKAVLPFRYDSIIRLNEGTFKLRSSDLLGLADSKGNVLIEPRFSRLENLGNGIVIAGREGKYGLLTREGLSTLPMVYDQLNYDPTRQQYLVLKKASWRKF